MKTKILTTSTNAKVLFFGLPKRRNLLVTSTLPIKTLVKSFAKKLLKLKVSASQANRLVDEFIAVNLLAQSARLNKRRNVFGWLRKTKSELANLRANKPKRVLPDWRKRQLQRKLDYRKRKVMRKKRFLRWRAFRRKRRWKRVIARRFARSYLVHQPNYNLVFGPAKRRLASVHDTVGLQVEAVTTISRPPYLSPLDSPVFSLPLTRVNPDAVTYKLKKTQAWPASNRLLHEVTRFNALFDSPSLSTSRFLDMPMEELLVACARLGSYDLKAAPSATQLHEVTAQQFSFENKLVTVLSDKEARAKGRHWVRRSVFSKTGSYLTLDAIYRKSLRDVFGKSVTALAAARRAGCKERTQGMEPGGSRVTITAPKSDYLELRYGLKNRFLTTAKKWQWRKASTPVVHDMFKPHHSKTPLLTNNQALVKEIRRKLHSTPYLLAPYRGPKKVQELPPEESEDVVTSEGESLSDEYYPVQLEGMISSASESETESMLGFSPSSGLPRPPSYSDTDDFVEIPEARVGTPTKSTKVSSKSTAASVPATSLDEPSTIVLISNGNLSYDGRKYIISQLLQICNLTRSKKVALVASKITKKLEASELNVEPIKSIREIKDKAVSSKTAGRGAKPRPNTPTTITPTPEGNLHINLRGCVVSALTEICRLTKSKKAVLAATQLIKDLESSSLPK